MASRWDLGLTSLARLAGQGTPGIYLSPSLAMVLQTHDIRLAQVLQDQIPVFRSTQ